MNRDRKSQGCQNLHICVIESIYAPASLLVTPKSKEKRGRSGQAQEDALDADQMKPGLEEPVLGTAQKRALTH